MTIQTFLAGHHHAITLLSGIAVIGAFLLKDVFRDRAKEARDKLIGAKRDFRSAINASLLSDRIRVTTETQLFIINDLINKTETAYDRPTSSAETFRIQTEAAHWRLEDLRTFLGALIEITERFSPISQDHKNRIDALKSTHRELEGFLYRKEQEVAHLFEKKKPIDWQKFSTDTDDALIILYQDTGLRFQTIRAMRSFFNEFDKKLDRTSRHYELLRNATHAIYIVGLIVATGAQFWGLELGG